MTMYGFMETLRQLKVIFWLEGERLRCRAPAGVLTAELQAQIVQNKAEIIELVKKNISATQLNEAEIQPRPVGQQALPLSFAQQRLWFLHQLEPENPVNNCFYGITIEGLVDVELQNRCLTEVIRRHESLRTTFSLADGEPIQVIQPPYEVSLPLYDIQMLASEAQMSFIAQISREIMLQPYDLENGPLLRYALIQRSEKGYLLLLGMHHIIFDGWSLGVIVREVMALYTAYQNGKPSPLAALPIQYADFALWQRHKIEHDLSQIEYWRKQLSSLSVDLALPFDRARPTQATFTSGVVYSFLSAQQTARLKAVSQSEGVTIFMTLLAAFQWLLARYTGQDDIAAGTMIANRNRVEIEALVGFFVNTLVMRVSLAGDPTVQELLRRVREVALKAYANQDLPFEKLVEELHPERVIDRLPFVQVSFDFHNMRKDPLIVPGFVVETFDTAIVPAIATDIAVEIDDDGHQGLEIRFYYQADLFEPRTIERMVEHYVMLLDAIVQDTRQRLSDLSLLTAQEQRQLLSVWQGTTDEKAYERSVLAWLEGAMTARPDAVALVAGEMQMSYGKLHEQANILASLLQELPVRQEQVVALLMDRGIELITAIIAVMRTGGAFLLLDPQYPDERLASMLQQGHVQILIASTSATAVGLRLAAQSKWPIRVREYSTLLSSSTSISAGDLFVVKSSREALAYVLYTSGSTGLPKGAMISQRGMINHLHAKIQDLQISTHDRLAQTASQSFDIVIWQCLAGLLAGATVHIFGSDITCDPQALFERVEEQAITILELVPAVLQVYLNYTVAQPALQTLRHLLLTGEQLSADLVRQWQFRYTHIPLVNAYGPTECSDDVTHALIACPLTASVSRVPIGSPICNTRLYILDQHKQMLPPGLPGELYIGGQGVGRGYIGNPAQTASVFLPDPYASEPGARCYKTGDRARWLPDGQVEFLGRIDQQVKLRGFRIELEEVETLLQRQALVQECAVLLHTEEGIGPRLVAYLALKEPAIQHEEQLFRHYLEQFLPGYMVPEIFVELERLPRLPNGKLDRLTLPAPAIGSASAHFVAPRTPVEELVAACWCNVLGLKQVGIHENFFELGGHSLLATRLISRLRATLQVELPLRSLFEAPTVARLAERVEAARYNGQEKATPAIVPVSREQDLPLSFAQQRLWILDQLEPQNTSYNVSQFIRMRGTLHVGALESSLQEVVRRHEILRTIFAVHEERPVQVVKKEMTFTLLQVDLRQIMLEEREASMHRLLDEQAHTPFDLSCGPLLRGQLLYIDEQEYILALTLHHIVVDGWSFAILFHEVTTFYDAFLEGKPSLLPALPLQYADFAAWQRHWLQGERLDSCLAYWKKQLQGASAMELAVGRTRPKTQSSPGALYSFTLPDELSQALTALSRQEDVTLFMTLLTAFQILLYRSTGQKDIVVGTAIANRTRAEIEPLIGFFVNLLALRTNLSGRPSFRSLLARVREMVLSAYTYQDLPFEMLIDSLRLEREAARTPLLNVMFTLQNKMVFHSEAHNLTLDTFAHEMDSSNFDMTVFVAEVARGLSVSVNYNTDLFESASIARMFRHFEVLLQSIVSGPDTQIEALEIYSEAEKLQSAREKTEMRSVLRRKLQIAKGEGIDVPKR